MEKKKVVVIEDDDFYRNGLATILQTCSNYTLSGSYSSCEDAFDRLQMDDPDIVLMDIELPGMDGISGIGKIKKTKPLIDIIVFSIHDDTQPIINALKAGAIGYVSKKVSNYFSEVIDAMDSLATGSAPLSGRIAKKLVLSMHRARNSPLSSREQTILELLAQGKTYTQIADKLYLSKNTVRTHMRNIYEKLHVNGKGDAIEKAQHAKLI